MDRLRNTVSSSWNFPAHYTPGDVYFSPRGLIFLGYIMVSVSSWIITFFFFLTWRKIALQHCVGFCHTAEKIRHNYVCVAAFLSFHLFHQYWFPRFHVYALIDDTCLSVSDLLCMGGFRFTCVTATDSDLFLSNGQLVLHHIYMYQVFFIRSSVDGYLGCFHVLTIVNSAGMNTGMSFQIVVFWGDMLSSGITGSIGRFIPSVLKNLYTVSYNSLYPFTFPPMG